MSSPRWHGPLLAALALPVFFYGIASHGVNGADEAYYHGVAEHMVESGNWLRIVFRGTPSVYDAFVNAPLQYWIRAAAIWLFGSSYWTMRAPSALCAIAGLLVTYRLARRVAGPRAALLAGLVQLTTFQLVYMHSGRTGVLEPAVALLYTWTALSFLEVVETGRGLVPHHLSLVLLANLKTPVVGTPVLAELACFALVPSTRWVFRRWLGLGVLAAPIGLAWHIGNAVAYADELPGIIASMHAQGAGAGGFLVRRLENVGYYASALLYGCLPWVLVYPLALARGVLRPVSEEDATRARVLAIFALVVLGYFSAIGKRYHWYVIPAIPILSVFVAVFIDRLADRRPGHATVVWVGAAAAFLLLLDPQPDRANPFLQMADFFQVRGRGQTPLRLAHPVLLVPLAAGLVGAGYVLRRTAGERAGRWLAVGLTVGLLGYGSIRVVEPLRRVDYESEAFALRRRIDAARAAGRAPEPPLRVRHGSAQGWIARFYFARDFDLVAEGGGYRLVPLSTPAVPGRSEQRSTAPGSGAP